MTLFDYFCYSKKYCVYKLYWPNGDRYYGKTCNFGSRYYNHTSKSGNRNRLNQFVSEYYGKADYSIIFDFMPNEVAECLEWCFIDVEYDINNNAQNFPYLKDTYLMVAITSILNLTINLEEKK